MPGRSWNEPDILELARLTVMVLSGADEQPLKFNKLQDWIGENRGGNLTRSSPGGARGLGLRRMGRESDCCRRDGAS
jgi:hypothetical protein